MKKILGTALALVAFFLMGTPADAKTPLVCSPVKVACAKKVCRPNCEACQKKCHEACKFKLYCRAKHPICGQYAYDVCVRACRAKGGCVGSCCGVVKGVKVCKRQVVCRKVVCVRAPCPPVCSCVVTNVCTPCK